MSRPSADDDACPRDAPASKPRQSVSIDWYAEGQTRMVEVAGVRIVVRFIGRKGRRGRIAIEAPAGAVFREQFELGG
jgi:hypothetical protein